MKRMKDGLVEGDEEKHVFSCSVIFLSVKGVSIIASHSVTAWPQCLMAVLADRNTAS